MLIIAFVLAAIGMRFLPHAWDFTPVMAMLLLAGSRMKRRQLWIPVVALVASDFALNLWVYHAPGGADQYFTWAAYLIVLAVASLTLRGSFKVPALAGASLGASTLFFLISNFGVWVTGLMYPHTWAGLVTCFAMGVPFYRNAAAGDLVFTAAFFGLYALIEQRLRVAAPEAA